MNICFLGGGNVATLAIGDIGTKEDISVCLLTSRPSAWKRCIEVYDRSGRVKHVGKLDLVSDQPADVVPDADVLISTVPSHVFPEVLARVRPFLRKDTLIGLLPGSGGREFYTRDLVDGGNTVFGFQRVPGVARTKEYGRSVYDLGKRAELHIAAMPASRTDAVFAIVNSLMDMPCRALPSYLNVTLVPSNPVLHTSRLYSMFRTYEAGVYYAKEIGFYDEWTDESSETLLACDAELQRLCDALSEIDLSGVRSLRDHYESATAEQLTSKIRSIESLKGIRTPMVQTERGFVPDLNSRYFAEDFPYGLCIIKGFCEIVSLDTPVIDTILRWYERLSGVNYFVGERFCGSDLASLPLPQNFGITSAQDVVTYYTRRV